MIGRNILYILLAWTLLSSFQVVYGQTDNQEAKIIAFVDSLSTSGIDTTNLLLSVDSAAIDSPKIKIKPTVNLDPPPISDIISARKIFWSIMFLLTGLILIRILLAIINFFAEKSTRHRITLKGLIPVVKIVGWLIILFIIIKVILQPPLATFIAVSASIGVAIGFAAQDILKNIFGGIIILIERPFKVGDKIEVTGHYGEVLEVGLRSTRIVTADDSVIVIPNGELMSKSISNSNSGEPNCQVVAEIYLPIDVNTTTARKLALEVAKVSKYVYLNKPITVLFFNEFKERRSYIKMRLKAYVFDIRDEFAFKSDMTEMVVREFIKADLIKEEK